MTGNLTSSIRNMTLLLSMVAGFTDTATFLCADNLFSAHVTGNFVVFVYNILQPAGNNAWIKMASFPVFFLSIAFAGRFLKNRVGADGILAFEAYVLIVAGLLAFIGKAGGANNFLNFPPALLAVFAMGLQNAYGKLFPSDTLTATTVMTGNITQLSLDLANALGRIT
jgi:uncharacterized membrane protein YoaK (UPF0700 family)